MLTVQKKKKEPQNLQVTSERSETISGNEEKSTLKPKQFTLTGETVCLCVWVNVCICDGEDVGGTGEWVISVSQSGKSQRGSA